jgi:hypothetical protein
VIDDEKREPVSIADVSVESHWGRVELVGERAHRKLLHSAATHDVDGRLHDSFAGKARRTSDGLSRSNRFGIGDTSASAHRLHSEAKAESHSLTYTISEPLRSTRARISRESSPALPGEPRAYPRHSVVTGLQ